MATSDSAESTRPTPPFTTTGVHVVFHPGDTFTVTARLEDDGDVVLTATVSHLAGIVQLTLQGDRAAVNRAVKELSGKLAALDAEGAGQ